MEEKKSCQNSRTLDNLVIQYPEASCTLIFKEIISSLWAIRREIIGSDLIFFIYFAQQLVKPLFELCMFVCQSRHGKICHDFVFSPIALLKPLQIDYKKKFNFSNTMKTRLKRDVVCVCCVVRSFISQAWISDSKKLRVAKSKWEVCYAFKSKLLYWWGGNLPHLCIWLVRYIREKFEEMMMSCLGVWFSSWASSLNDTSYYIWKLPLALFKITFLRSLQRRSSSVSRICMQQYVFFRAL